MELHTERSYSTTTSVLLRTMIGRVHLMLNQGMSGLTGLRCTRDGHDSISCTLPELSSP